MAKPIEVTQQSALVELIQANSNLIYHIGFELDALTKCMEILNSRHNQLINLLTRPHTPQSIPEAPKPPKAEE